MKAQAAFEQWASEAQPESLDLLLQLSKGHSDAEVRIRAVKTLEKLVGRIYEANGEGYIGIRMNDKAVVLPGEEKRIPAVLIIEVVPDSAAARAGMRPGDCITRIAGEGFSSLPQNQLATSGLRQRIQQMKPGTTIEIEILRGAQLSTLSVTLGRRPAALDEMGLNYSLKLASELEKQRKEEHFRKWLLEHNDQR